ncbi:pectate lyase [Candidatus Sumerlaeota bacterium]|nr:pectate lyase [Candidatus Sumerlaeota bacterium]
MLGILLALALSIPSAKATATPTDDAPIGWAAVRALDCDGTTGGEGGEVVTVTTLEEFQDYAGRHEPYIILVKGTIVGRTEAPPERRRSIRNLGPIKAETLIERDKTILGVGDDATFVGGLAVFEASNVVIRNLTLRDGVSDALKILVHSHHVWIDHCDFQNFASGAIDISRSSDYITVSWCHFRDRDRAVRIGHKDNNVENDDGLLAVTLHHNWFDGTRERNPRVRFSRLTHVFNNYFSNIGGYAVASTREAHVRVEGNYFRNVAVPFYSVSSVGGSPPGSLVEQDNVFENCGATRETRGSVPEARAFYPYTLDPAERVPEIVMRDAGTGQVAPTEEVGRKRLSATLGSD